MNDQSGSDRRRAAAPHANDLASLLADIRARRSEFTAQQQVSQDIVERFRMFGVYRALVAKRFGGDERTPAEFCRLIEAISEADGSAGWVASFGASATYLAALPEPTLRQLYAEGPDVIFAGGLFPLQPAKRTTDGLVLNGRWKFVSGCTGADMIGAGVFVEGEAAGALPRMAVAPASRVRIEPNWDVIGLQGTGSHDIVMTDVLVPEEWTMIRGGAPSVDAPIYLYPALGLAAQVLAVVGLGVARAALNELAGLAGGRASITGAPRLADRAYVQSEFAKAEAALRSARAFFYESTERVWSEVQSDAKFSVEAAATLRLAATYAARSAAEVARVAAGIAGTTSIYTGHGLARAMCDSLVVAQHAFLGEGTYQNAGRILLGFPREPGFP